MQIQFCQIVVSLTFLLCHRFEHILLILLTAVSTKKESRGLNVNKYGFCYCSLASEAACSNAVTPIHTPLHSVTDPEQELAYFDTRLMTQKVTKICEDDGPGT